MITYHFVAASERFLTVEEPLEEVLRERQRHYGETGRTVDFWLLRRPGFLDSAGLAAELADVPRPAAAVVSTDASFIDFMKLRLEFVKRGSFEAPSPAIPDPLAEGSAADPPGP
ncbi:MAG: MgPME-cyclase complex family protein [Cyanobacteriota bacterium]|nr:MgPME-cyclase complex family protein [Cyanobacteriota bacterium]